MSELLVQTDVSAAALSLSPFSCTGGMAVVVRWSCSYSQSVQLARLTVWTPLLRPAVAGRHNNKALVDTDAEGGGGAGVRGGGIIHTLPRPPTLHPAPTSRTMSTSSSVLAYNQLTSAVQ